MLHGMTEHRREQHKHKHQPVSYSGTHLLVLPTSYQCSNFCYCGYGLLHHTPIKHDPSLRLAQCRCERTKGTYVGVRTYIHASSNAPEKIARKEKFTTLASHTQQAQGMDGTHNVCMHVLSTRCVCCMYVCNIHMHAHRGQGTCTVGSVN